MAANAHASSLSQAAGVRIELREAGAPPSVFQFDQQESILIGTVPGCDLRLADASLPSLVCLLQHTPTAIRLRKLAPLQNLKVNGAAQKDALLQPNDVLSIGDFEMRLDFSVKNLPDAQNLSPLTDDERRQLEAAQRQLEEDRRDWEQDAERQAECLALRSRQLLEREQAMARANNVLLADKAAIEGKQKSLDQQVEALRRDFEREMDDKRQELERREADLVQKEALHLAEKRGTDREQAQLKAVREELFEQYRKRKDSLTAMQSAVELAARKVQQQKRELEAGLANARGQSQASHLLQEQLAARLAEVEAERRALAEQDRLLRQKQAAANESEARLRQQAQELMKGKDALEHIRQEVEAIRTELYDKYHQRQQQLQLMREAILRAGRKVQESRRQLESDRLQHQQQCQAQLERQKETAAAKEQLEQDRQALGEQNRLLEEWKTDVENEIGERQAAVQAEESRVGAQRQEIEQACRELQAGQAQYQADLTRLERLRSTLEARQEEQDARGRQLDERAAKLERDSAELQQHGRHLAETLKQLQNEQEEQARLKEALANEQRLLEERTGRLEAQQAALASLRTRLERQQAELHARDQQLTTQRVGLDAMEAGLRESSRQMRDQQAQLRAEREEWTQAQQEIQLRCAHLEAAVEQMRRAQDAFEQADQELQERHAALEEETRQSSQGAQLVRLRAERVQALRNRLLAGRQALKQREAALAQAEQTREALQEQLRMRSDTLAAREKDVAEQVQKLHETALTLARRQAELEARKETFEQSLEQQNNRDKDLAERTAALQAESVDLQQRAADLDAERLALQKERAEVADLRRQIDSTRERLPELAQQARDALQRLEKARAQLREHLNEVHAYARECHAELANSQRDLEKQAEHLRDQQRLLARDQDEHRHTVGAFRQHLSEWQGRVAELKRTLADGESSLQKRQVQLDRHLDETSNRLAEQERDVTRWRDELNRRLRDMQGWYRSKLRELAERKLLNPGALELAGEAAVVRGPWPDSDAAGDQSLADLLTRMHLVEPETLSALLDEARRQGSSLRDALINDGCLTPYQIQLIEAGTLEALAIGPLRVIDRLLITAMETVYRVFDPRSGREALLRQLSPSAGEVRIQEFRRLYSQASKLRHTNLALTWEVLETDGGPAVLQEWITGLPSGEWPASLIVPAVWLRLLSQAAAGLQAAHEANVCHGHLHAGRLLLTEQGDVKVCGLGEPAWLISQEDAAISESLDVLIARDLQALGTIARSWLPSGSRSRTGKSVAKEMREILARMLGDGSAERYPSAAVLLRHLDEVRALAGDDSVAWAQLLAHVRDRLQMGSEATEQRQSA